MRWNELSEDGKNRRRGAGKGLFPSSRLPVFPSSRLPVFPSVLLRGLLRGKYVKSGLFSRVSPGTPVAFYRGGEQETPPMKLRTLIPTLVLAAAVAVPAGAQDRERHRPNDDNRQQGERARERQQPQQPAQSQ